MEPYDIVDSLFEIFEPEPLALGLLTAVAEPLIVDAEQLTSSLPSAAEHSHSAPVTAGAELLSLQKQSNSTSVALQDLNCKNAYKNFKGKSLLYVLFRWRLSMNNVF